LGARKAALGLFDADLASLDSLQELKHGVHGQESLMKR
jgi:hypothetical protein